jgi:hypothetical protein
MTVIGLRLHPPYQREVGGEMKVLPAHADLIAQPWRFSAESIRGLSPETLTLVFPHAAGPGVIGTTDAWYEFERARVVGASLTRGRLSLAPGRVLQDLADFMPYYRERYEGALTIPEAISGQVRHTFLVER